MDVATGPNMSIVLLFPNYKWSCWNWLMGGEDIVNLACHYMPSLDHWLACFDMRVARYGGRAKLHWLKQFGRKRIINHLSELLISIKWSILVSLLLSSSNCLLICFTRIIELLQPSIAQFWIRKCLGLKFFGQTRLPKHNLGIVSRHSYRYI